MRETGQIDVPPPCEDPYAPPAPPEQPPAPPQTPPEQPPVTVNTPPAPPVEVGAAYLTMEPAPSAPADSAPVETLPFTGAREAALALLGLLAVGAGAAMLAGGRTHRRAH
jgi:hypothetical protein